MTQSNFFVIVDAEQNKLPKIEIRRNRAQAINEAKQLAAAKDAGTEKLAEATPTSGNGCCYFARYAPYSAVFVQEKAVGD